MPFQYSFTTENAIAIAAAQQLAFEQRVKQIDTTFSADLTAAARKILLASDLPDLSDSAKATLAGLDPAGWAAVRTEAARVLDATLRTELRDTDVEDTKTRLAGRMAGQLDESERMLAAEIISPLVVPNSSLDLQLTAQARDKAAEAVAPVPVTIRQGEVIVREGSPLTRRPTSRRSMRSGCASRSRMWPASVAGSCWPCWSSPCSSRGCGASARRSGTATTS